AQREAARFRAALLHPPASGAAAVQALRLRGTALARLRWRAHDTRSAPASRSRARGGPRPSPERHLTSRGPPMRAPDPFATATPLTRREVVRALMPFTRRSTAKGVSLVAAELALYWLAILGVLYLPGWGWKIAAALFAGTRLGNFVILGHDAAHGALTPHKRLNWLLG